MSLLRVERKRREGIFFAFYSIISRASEDDRLTAVGKREKSVIDFFLYLLLIYDFRNRLYKSISPTIARQINARFESNTKLSVKLFLFQACQQLDGGKFKLNGSERISFRFISTRTRPFQNIKPVNILSLPGLKVACQDTSPGTMISRVSYLIPVRYPFPVGYIP